MTVDGPTHVETMVMDAFKEVKSRLESRGRMVAIERSGAEASIYSTRRGKLEIKFTIRIDEGAHGAMPVVETAFTDSITHKDHKTEPELMQRGEEDATSGEFTEEDIVASFFEHYRAVAPRD